MVCGIPILILPCAIDVAIFITVFAAARLRPVMIMGIVIILIHLRIVVGVVIVLILRLKRNWLADIREGIGAAASHLLITLVLGIFIGLIPLLVPLRRR